MPEAGIPESFKVLVKEIRSLALDIKPISYRKVEKAPAPAANTAERDAIDMFAMADDADSLIGAAGDLDDGVEALIGEALNDKE